MLHKLTHRFRSVAVMWFSYLAAWGQARESDADISRMRRLIDKDPPRDGVARVAKR